MTQFVAIRYAHTDKRSYTFVHEGEPVAPGEFVEVSLRNGEPKVVEVVEVTDKAPPFTCKPVLSVGCERPASWPIPTLFELSGGTPCFQHDTFQQDCIDCASMN